MAIFSHLPNKYNFVNLRVDVLPTTNYAKLIQSPERPLTF